MVTTTFVGGKLNFKGEKKKKKKANKKKRKSKHKNEEEAVVVDDDDDLTEVEKRSLKIKQIREEQDLKKLATKSHRERIEQFNDQLGQLTEHNDIPRVSAAGNG